jgi:Protoglobin
MHTQHTIPGYGYGQTTPSPLTEADLDLLKQTVLFTTDDEQYLRTAGEVLADQTDALLDVWYGFVGSHPHLLAYFTQNGQPDMNYLAAVRKRFGQWIQDTCTRPYDQTWLHYQYEIALRHHSIKKNKTDEAAAGPIVHLRYIIAFIVPLTLTIQPFLSAKGHSPEVVEAMYNAWFKALTLTALLWSQPYIHENEF